MVFAGFSALAVAAGPEVPLNQAVAGRDVAAMVRDLKDPNFKVREQATQDIWGLGDSALPALKAAASSDDPEQAFRARELLRKIQLQIRPNTDPDVIAMVDRFSKAVADEKIAIFSRLMQKRAWRQMLKLYAEESKGEVRRKLRPMMTGVAVRAAREALRADQPQNAKELIEMAPADSECLLALADFHRTHGTLQAEMERAKTSKVESSKLWLLAMQRVAGNVSAAREAADAAHQMDVGAGLAALDGDPLPWLQARVGVVADNDPFEDDDMEPPQRPFGRGNHDRGLSKAYLSAVVKRWKGHALTQKDIAPLVAQAASKTLDDARAAMVELFLLGEVAIAEKSFAKQSPLAAFIHFDSLERVPEALSALGLDPAKPDYKDWVAKRFKKLTSNEIEDQHGVATESDELLLLAGFFERRGMRDEAWEVFSGPLSALAAEDEGVYHDLIGRLFGNRTTASGAPGLAGRHAKEWAGADAKKWESLIDAVFGDDGENSAWWTWLEELAPKASIAERFDAMCALQGLGTDAGHLREKWFGRAWKYVDALPAEKREEYEKHILSLALELGDVGNSLKAWDRIPAESRPTNSWIEVMFHLSAAGRWADCSAVILKQIEKIVKSGDDQNPALHAYAAAALRMAGRKDEADVHDALLEKLLLGDATTAIQAGHAYAFGMDFDRAAVWWRRAALLANPQSSEFAVALKLHSEALIRSGKWKEIASVSEVLTAIESAEINGLESPLPVMRLRLQADVARALRDLKLNRPAAIELLNGCHKTFARDGSLADFFFPAVRGAGLLKEHDAWFETSWAQMMEVVKLYPNSDNTANTVSWLAARATRRLDEAEKLLGKALAVRPFQSAYLDTMAEIQFASGHREKAIEWSATAVKNLPHDPDLRRQQFRFTHDPLPK